MEFAEKIMRLRKVQGLSQDELAEQLGVSRQAVSKWESGQAMPEVDKLVKLADAFGLQVDDLLRPTATDELKLKTAILEKQQQAILSQQRKAQNRQFLIISSIISILAILVLYGVGKYIMFPDVGEGYPMLGKTVVIYGGTLVVIAVAVCLNWRFRRKTAARQD